MSIGRNSFLRRSLIAAMLVTLVPVARSADIDGGRLVEQSDCIACHTLKGTEQRIGPPFETVAQQYKGADVATIDRLANKIQKGGGGTWGLVPMISHPQLSHAETAAIVRWILSRRSTNPEAGSLKQPPAAAP